MPASIAAGPLLVACGLLRYPDASLRTDLLPEFHDEVARVSPEGMQELYTMTFDLNPVATLEAGWHLWGEQYERGRFLADLRARQDALGIDAGTELPDHLPVLLEMLEREFDAELATQVLAALEKIEKPLHEQGNPYRHVIAAARAAIRGVQEARA
jgi:nitrate reductase molybdenum cofactor assembly chaperone NarJ/NarW